MIPRINPHNYCSSYIPGVNWYNNFGKCLALPTKAVYDSYSSSLYIPAYVPKVVNTNVYQKACKEHP